MSCLVQSRALKKKDPLPYSGIPSSQDFADALSASIAAFRQQPHGGDVSVECQIVKVTVVEKGDRRGSAYVDFNSAEAAEFAVKACAAVPAVLTKDWWKEQPLQVQLKQQLPQEGGASVPRQLLNNAEQKAPAAAAAAASSSSTATTTAKPAAALAPTLFVQCRNFNRIHHVFDFFRGHGVTGHADECVFVATSKKPYFLVEWGKNTGSFDASLALDGAMVDGGNEVKIARATQTAADYKSKNPAALSLASKREGGAVRQREEADAKASKTAAAMASFVPLAMMMKQQQQQPKGGDDDDG
jgi:hypothetical protein